MSAYNINRSQLILQKDGIKKCTFFHNLCEDNNNETSLELIEGLS